MAKTFTEEEKTLSQQRRRRLSQRIVEGRLRSEQRLPLRRLATVLGMSMAPIREALREP